MVLRPLIFICAPVLVEEACIRVVEEASLAERTQYSRRKSVSVTSSSSHTVKRVKRKNQHTGV